MLFAAERQALLAYVLLPANRAVGAVDDVSVDGWFCGLTASSALRCCGCFGHCVSPGCFPNAPGLPGASVKNPILCTGQRSLSRQLPSDLWPSSSHALLQRALRMRSPVPSADMRSNRCLPLRDRSAGYASASSASIRLLKSGSLRCVAAT